MISLHDAPPAPRGLLYLATFNGTERGLIRESPALRDMIRDAAPDEWNDIVLRWREAEAGLPRKKWRAFLID